MCCHARPKKCLEKILVCTTAPEVRKNRLDLIKVRIFGQSCFDVWCCHYGACGPMATNPAPLFQSGLCLFVPLLSVSTVLCSSTNEFICTSPFLNQHINPDHWSHPRGKTVPLQAWRAASDWPFHLGPPLDPLLWVSAHLHFNTVPAHTQPPAPHAMTHCQQPVGVSKTALLGAQTACHRIVHYIQEWSCGNAWTISMLKKEGMKLRALTCPPPPQIDQTLLLYLHKPPAEMVYHKYRVKPSSAMWYTVKNACNLNCKRC